MSLSPQPAHAFSLPATHLHHRQLLSCRLNLSLAGQARCCQLFALLSSWQRQWQQWQWLWQRRWALLPGLHQRLAAPELGTQRWTWLLWLAACSAASGQHPLPVQRGCVGRLTDSAAQFSRVEADGPRLCFWLSVYLRRRLTKERVTTYIYEATRGKPSYPCRQNAVPCVPTRKKVRCKHPDSLGW